MKYKVEVVDRFMMSYSMMQTEPRATVYPASFQIESFMVSKAFANEPIWKSTLSAFCRFLPAFGVCESESASDEEERKGVVQFEEQETHISRREK